MQQGQKAINIGQIWLKTGKYFPLFMEKVNAESSEKRGTANQCGLTQEAGCHELSGSKKGSLPKHPKNANM